ncbi:hypothetical protein CDL12_09702 [Handroanthus impetiginosus]|uniref:Uncharacterized protein n=1 Tax=Handroanthus impetiginosus TaxID=429701 RepID=A0A2G9HJF0_9LAMI|nr:hypothetical protein CDL12_09702 [Handroanthus impetiginosus]
MKYVSLCLMALLLFSHFPFPTLARENIPKLSNKTKSHTLEQGKQTLDRDQPRLTNSQEMVVQIKKRARMIPGGTRARTRSSAVREQTSLLQVYFVLNFSIFFVFFLF